MGDGMRLGMPARRRDSRPTGEMDGAMETSWDELLDGDDVSADELREFLAADMLDVPVDPEFKESLRARLWEMVRLRYGKGGGGSR